MVESKGCGIRRRSSAKGPAAKLLVDASSPMVAVLRLYFRRLLPLGRGLGLMLGVYLHYCSTIFQSIIELLLVSRASIHTRLALFPQFSQRCTILPFPFDLPFLLHLIRRRSNGLNSLPQSEHLLWFVLRRRTRILGSITLIL